MITTRFKMKVIVAAGNASAMVNRVVNKELAIIHANLVKSSVYCASLTVVPVKLVTAALTSET